MISDMIFLPWRTYAEMHFRLFPGGSSLYRDFPEIIFDIPFRLNHDSTLPLYILIKDADRFPARLRSLHLKTPSGESILKMDIKRTFQEKWYWERLEMPNPFPHPMTFTFFVHFQLERYGKIHEFINDTYKHSPKLPFRISLASGLYPGSGKVWWGELHCHSNFTEDQIEFGSPVAMLQAAARDLQLNFVMITDHSYDLNQDLIKFFRQKHNPEKFRRFMDHFASSDPSPVMIPGIEVSVGGYRKKNLHLLIWNPSRHYDGYGDSGRRIFKHSPTLMLTEVLAGMDTKAVAVAAHPLKPVKKLHQILLNRGTWMEKDLIAERIAGFQILNGIVDDGFRRGLETWVSFLLKGMKKYIYAGSDSHGNLNLYRQIQMPFRSMEYNYTHQFGRMRTGIYRRSEGETPDKFRFLTSLKKGCCFISSGPYLSFSIDHQHSLFLPGDSIPVSMLVNGQMKIEAESTEEFGSLENLILIGGFTGKAQEKRLREFFPSGQAYQFEEIMFWKDLGIESPPAYIRVECRTSEGELAFTNPIWID